MRLHTTEFVLRTLEHRRAQRAVTAWPRAVMVRLHPSALTVGDEVLLEEHLACTEEERVRLPPSPSRLRSVNGKHTPFVRPGCGFESCRRLSRTPVAQRTELRPATTEVAGSNPAGRTRCGRSSAGRAPERHSGEARSIRAVRFEGPWCNRKHGELQPRWSGFESWRVCWDVASASSPSRAEAAPVIW